MYSNEIKYLCQTHICICPYFIYFFSDENWKLKDKVSNLKKMLKLKRGGESFDSDSQMTDTWYVHNFS